MCDFRGAPFAVQDIHTDEVIMTGPCKTANATSFDNPHYGTPLKDVTEPGMYYICATGSHYAYFDGENWWKDRDDWGPPSEVYWQDTDGVPPQYLKYRFLRTSENERSRCWLYDNPRY